MKRRYESMYECGDCEAVFSVVVFRMSTDFTSMPEFLKSLHCPFCLCWQRLKKIARAA